MVCLFAYTCVELVLKALRSIEDYVGSRHNQNYQLMPNA